MSATDPTARPDRATIAVCADPPKDRDLLRAAARLAVDLNLPFAEKPPKKGYEMLLVAAPGRIELRVIGGEKEMRAGKPVFADLGRIDVTSNAGRSLKQPIAKALGLKKKPDPSNPPVVIDATAGWGEDTWIMAGLGCRVLAVERNKVLATMLRDAVLRACTDPDHPDRPAMLQRISIVNADARHMLRRIVRIHEEPGDLPAEMQGFLQPDVVFIDPMFPGGRKTAERKPMKVVRRLVGDDGDAGELFEWAIRVAKRRVVVKRPAKGEPLATDVKPTVVHKAKSLRYDVYVPRA